MTRILTIGFIISTMLNFSTVEACNPDFNIFPSYDTSQIDKHLLGKYKVVKISTGYLTDSGRVIKSVERPENMIAELAPKSVKILSGGKVEYSNLGQKMEESDETARITQFLCTEPGSDLKMLIIVENLGNQEIEVGVVDMMESDFINYELAPL